MPQWDYFPYMSWNVFPVISCHISCSFIFLPLLVLFPPFFSLFAVVVVAFWQNSPHNCRCNALSASLEVIMRSVCFCEDNRESQRILSCFPDGRVREGVERAFVCMEADRERQIRKHKLMSPLNIPQQAYFSCDIHLDNKMDMNCEHLLLLLFFPFHAHLIKEYWQQ